MTDWEKVLKIRKKAETGDVAGADVLWLLSRLGASGVDVEGTRDEADLLLQGHEPGCPHLDYRACTCKAVARVAGASVYAQGIAGGISSGEPVAQPDAGGQLDKVRARHMFREDEWIEQKAREEDGANVTAGKPAAPSEQSVAPTIFNAQKVMLGKYQQSISNLKRRRRMKKDKNTESKQAIYRGVNCPTCHSKAGDHCRSMGLRGKAAGNIMPTSCHDARIIASGNTPRSVERSELRAKTVKARGAKRHQAGKRSWATRRRKEVSRVATAQLLESSGPALTPYELVADVLETLRVKPELEGASVINKDWSVSALRSTSHSLSISVVDLKG